MYIILYKGNPTQVMDMILYQDKLYIMFIYQDLFL